MQLDDRDIICETDYSPLSNEELAAQIEWHAAAMSGATAYDLERITGPARALLARAEAAEAEAGQLRDELAAMTERVTFARRSASLAENALETARSRWDEAERREKSIFDSAMDIADQRDTLAARVAELEATTAWRPVTEDWPPYSVQHLGRAMPDSPTLLITRYVDADDGEDIWLTPDGMVFYANDIRFCAAIPPAPQEPTP